MNVKEIIIGLGALQHVTKVLATGLVRLRLFEIGIGSLPLVTDFSIDLSSVVTWTYIARTKSMLLNAPIAISQLVIPDNSCNDADFTEWNLNDYKNLKQVVIGVNSLQSVKIVNADKLLNLQSFSIGDGSLASIQSFDMDTPSNFVYRHSVKTKTELLSSSSLITSLIIRDNSCNEDDFTELDLRRFLNVREIVIGSNALMKVTKVRAIGLRKLTEFAIGDGSLPLATDFSITSSSMITWSYIANTCSDFLQAPSIITELTIAENTCNENTLTSIDFSRFINLQKITIGRHSFKHVTSVNAMGMVSLQSFIIGSGSLPLVTSLGIEGTTQVEWKYTVATKSAFMSAPTGITELTIASNGCNEADFTSLDLSRFPLLHTLTIGSSSLTHVRSIEGSRPVHLSSVNIGESSLSQLPPTIVNSTVNLNSMPWHISELIVLDNTWNDIVMLDLRDFSLLKQITIGKNALQNVREIHLENLPLVESLVIGDNSLTSNYLYGFSFIQMNSLKTIQINKNSLIHPTSIQFNGLHSLHTLSIGEGSFKLVETIIIANNTMNNPLFVEFNLQSFVNLKNLEVSENSLQFVRTMNISKSNSLQSLIVKEGSLSSIGQFDMPSAIITTTTIDWEFRVSSLIDLSHAPSIISGLIIEPNSCNEFGFTELDFSRFTNIRSIRIGYNSFEYVTSMTLNGLNTLEEFSLESGCLPSLTTLAIGSNSLNHPSFTSFIINNQTTLQSITIGDNSLIYLTYFPLSSLSQLTSFVVGEGSIPGISSNINPPSSSNITIAITSLAELQALSTNVTHIIHIAIIVI